MKRVFLIVLDSFGIGEMADAAAMELSVNPAVGGNIDIRL